MYGSSIYGSSPLGYSYTTSEGSNYDFSFNGYNLNSDNVKVLEINYDDFPITDFQTYDAPLTDGGGVLGRFFHTRNIEMTLGLKSTDRNGLNTLIDEFKKNMRVSEARLEVKVNGDIRRCRATVIDLKINREKFQISFAPNVQVTFQTKDPFWQSKTLLTNTYTNTANPYTYTIANDGTYKTNPIFNLNFATGTSNVTSFTVTKDTTLTVNTGASAGDIFELDYETKTVKKNGTSIDYDGTFEPAEVGNEGYQFNFSGTGATVNMSISGNFYRKYL